MKRTNQQHAAPLPEGLTSSTGFMLAFVADAATTHYAAALQRVGVTPHQLGVLTLLDAEGPLVQARLGDRLRIVKPLMVGVVNDLERMGLVERRSHPRDGRAFEVHLLKAGRRRIVEATSVSQAATKAFFGALNRTETRTFHELLSRLANSHRPPGGFS